MIISRTPYRISLFGGGTDYPAWYRRHGGAVLATAIDKYCYLTARRLPPFFDHKHRVVWSKVESVVQTQDITHPAARAIIEHLKIESGLEIHCIGDLPARSGVGSSSTFTVGLLHALHALQGRMVSKHDLAMEAIHLEQEVLKEPVGSQDQTCAAYGGFNHIEFRPDGEVVVSPVTIPSERIDELNRSLMLFYTGIKRTSTGVTKTFIDDMESRSSQLRVLNNLVDEGLAVLNSDRPLAEFGRLFREAWDAKRSLSKAITNSDVDEIHKAALDAGALGGKLTGAGGGGFLLLFVEPDFQERVRQKLDRFLHVPFKFDYSGSRIVFSSREADYGAVEREREGKQIFAFKELVLPSEGESAPVTGSSRESN